MKERTGKRVCAAAEVRLVDYVRNGSDAVAVNASSATRTLTMFTWMGCGCGK